MNNELVGLQAQIAKSTNKSLVGLEGKIIDETMHMLTLQTVRGLKMIPKQHNVWKFTLSGQDLLIDGNTIAKRPEDRLRVKA
ncbi:MAG: ribonuclease P protein subunit [Candidatus Nitrosotenuis sp.]